MGQRDQLVPGSQHRFGSIEVDATIGGKRADVDLDADAIPQQLPGDDVGMMFERGKQDAVACLELRAAPAVGSKVDRLRRAAGEDYLAFISAERA